MQKIQQSKNMSYEKEINELKEKYNIDISMKGENKEAIKNHIKNKIMEINNKELEEEIKVGKNTKMVNEVNRNYLENFNFEEARAIFMMLTRMIDVKANYKNK